MRFVRRLNNGYAVVVGSLWLVGTSLALWDRHHTYYPTPETESAFLKSYTPQPVVESFQSNQFGHGGSSSLGGGAGREFVTRTGGFNSQFTIEVEKELPLMIALGDDLAKQLEGDGAQILRRSGNPQTGYRFDYRLDHSIGSVSVDPLHSVAEPVKRDTPLPGRFEEVVLLMSIEEKWFPKTLPTDQKAVIATLFRQRSW